MMQFTGSEKHLGFVFVIFFSFIILYILYYLLSYGFNGILCEHGQHRPLCMAHHRMKDM